MSYPPISHIPRVPLAWAITCFVFVVSERERETAGFEERHRGIEEPAFLV